MSVAVRGVLLSILKLLNFFLLVTGIFMIVYSGWIYKEWKNDHSQPPSPSVSLDGPSTLSGEFLRLIPDGDTNSRYQILRSDDPVPWFVYTTFGAGVFIVLVTLSGACAAESESPACFSCYQFGLVNLLLVQAVVAALIFFDKSWEKDLPDDPTGEAEKAKNFILENFEICKWGALAVLGVELLSLTLAIVLRSFAEQAPYEEDEFIESVTLADPSLLPSYYLPTAPPPKALGPSLSFAGPSEPASDAWRTRMVEKYGIDLNEFANQRIQTGVVRFAPPEKKGCLLM